MSNWSDSAYPDGQAAPSRGTSKLLVLGLAIVLVVGGIAAYVVFNDDSNPFAALLPAAAAPHSTASAPARGTTPVGSTSATPTSAPTASPTPDTPLARFAALSQTTNLPFHVTMSLSVVSQTEGKAKVTLAVDMAGKDFAGKVMISRTGSQSVAGNVIVVNNGWFLQKSAQSAWEQHTNPQLFTLTSTLLPQSAVASLTLVGVERRNGEQLYHLTSSYLPSPDMNLQLQASKCTVKAGGVDVWVRADGTPVSASYKDTCVYSNDHQDVTMSYEFSKVGEPVDIQTPDVASSSNAVAELAIRN